MPIIKIYPSKRDVSAIINYVSREGTVAETLIETSGCSKDTAEQDFKRSQNILTNLRMQETAVITI